MNLLFLNKVPFNQQAFAVRVIQICKNLGIANPNWLMFVMNSESGLDHQIVNKYKNANGDPEKGATGLIQFMPSTARSLGITNTALQKMSNIQQLDYVEKYYLMQGAKGKIKSFIDAYLVVFFPLAIGKPDQWIFETKNLSADTIAKANKIFDLNRDSKLTVLEVRQAMLNRVPESMRAELISIGNNIVIASKKKAPELLPPLLQPDCYTQDIEPTLNQEIKKGLNSSEGIKKIFNINWAKIFSRKNGHLQINHMGYINERLGKAYTGDNESIESECSDISFINQGTATVTVYCGDSANGRILLANEAVDFNNELGVKEITVYRIVFAAVGTKSLYVEKSYKKIV